MRRFVVVGVLIAFAVILAIALVLLMRRSSDPPSHAGTVLAELDAEL